MELELPMSKNQTKIKELQTRLETLPRRSPRRYWIRWRILLRRSVIVRTFLVVMFLILLAGVFITRQISTLDQRARAADKRSFDVDLARQKFDGEYRLYQDDHDDWETCLGTVQARENFRGLLNTIIDGVNAVLPNDAGAKQFTDSLIAYRDEKYQPIDPSTCGSEPRPPAIPQILLDLDEPVVIPSTTTIQGG